MNQGEEGTVVNKRDSCNSIRQIIVNNLQFTQLALLTHTNMQ